MSRTMFSVDDGDASPSSSTGTYIYQATALSPGRHTLFIQAHEGFALDHIEYAPSDTDDSPSPSSSDCAVVAGANKAGGNSDAAARIVGGVLGAAIVVLCAIITFLLCLRRKEHREGTCTYIHLIFIHSSSQPAQPNALPFPLSLLPVTRN